MTCVDARMTEQKKKKKAVLLPQLEDVKNIPCVSDVVL